MREEWRIKGRLLQELDSLRSRITQLEQSTRRETDEVSRKPEEAFRSIFNSVAEGVLLIDPENGQFLTGNKVICEMLGCDLEDIANLEVKDVYLQEDLDHVKEQLEKQRNGESAVSKAVPIKRRNGSIFLADIASVPFTFAGKTRVMSVFKEIPHRHIKTKMELSTSTDSFLSWHLTTTEIRVLRLIVNGKSCKEIAQLLHRSPRTIENHRAHLMNKLGVHSSAALVKKVLGMNVVEFRGEQRQEESLN